MREMIRRLRSFSQIKKNEIQSALICVNLRIDRFAFSLRLCASAFILN